MKTVFRALLMFLWMVLLASAGFAGFTHLFLFPRMSAQEAALRDMQENLEGILATLSQRERRAEGNPPRLSPEAPLEEASLPRPEVPAALTDAQISQVVGRHARRIESCLNKPLRQRQSLPKTMFVALSIHASGEVKEVRVQDPKIRQTAVAKCLTREIQRWRFPRFASGVRQASLPFELSPPQVSTSEASQGRLASAQIERVVRDHYDQVKRCMERQQRRNEGVYGKMLVRLMLDPSGEVEQAGVGPEAFRGTFIEECITHEVRRWRFPPFSGEAYAVEVPLLLAR